MSSVDVVVAVLGSCNCRCCICHLMSTRFVTLLLVALVLTTDTTFGYRCVFCCTYCLISVVIDCWIDEGDDELVAALVVVSCVIAIVWYSMLPCLVWML